MAETTLITITDIQSYRRVDLKFDTNRFNSFVTEAQRKNLRGLLGDALYFAFMADARTSGIYADLLNGKSYLYSSETIQYYGIKPVLCYWWLAIAARESDLFQSNVGAIQFTNNPQQNFETAREKERIASGYMETAQGYANDIIKFLNTNAASYPLWASDAETNKTNFTTFRVQ
jgi:hypothetical protein